MTYTLVTLRNINKTVNIRSVTIILDNAKQMKTLNHRWNRPGHCPGDPDQIPSRQIGAIFRLEEELMIAEVISSYNNLRYHTKKQATGNPPRLCKRVVSRTSDRGLQPEALGQAGGRRALRPPGHRHSLMYVCMDICIYIYICITSLSLYIYIHIHLYTCIHK